MRENKKQHHAKFIPTILTISFIVQSGFVRPVFSEENSPQAPPVEAEENKPIKEEIQEPEIETKESLPKSKAIENLRTAFINYDLGTAFGIIPRIAITTGKLPQPEEKKVVEPEDTPIEENQSEQEDTVKKTSSPKANKEKQKKIAKTKSASLSEKNGKSANEEQTGTPQEEEKEPAEVISSKNKSLANIFIYYGYSFLLDANAEAAKNCFITASVLDPENATAKCYIIESYGKLCQFENQKPYLEQLAELPEKSPFVYATLAQQQLRNKKTAVALKLIEKALQSVEGKPGLKTYILILKARAYGQLGLGEKTSQTYIDAADNTENDYIKEILLANSKLVVADLKGTKQHIVKAGKILPDDPIWQYKLGNYYSGENNKTKAIEYLLSSTVTERLSLSAYLHLANHYASEKQFDNALNAIAHVQKLIPYGATTYATKGSVLKRSGKYKDSISAYDEAIKRDPTFARVYYEIANLYTLLKQSDAAVRTFDQAVELMPDYWRVHFNFAEILWKLKLYDQAKEQALKGINLISAPADELNILAKHFLSRAHAMLGILFYQKKDIKRAIQEAVTFNKLKFLPELPAHLSYVKLRPERLTFASDLSEHDPFVQVALADMFYELNDLDNAEKHYRNAIEMSPNDADLNSFLTNVLTRKNDWGGAAKENFAYSSKIVNKIPGKIGELFSSKEKKEKE